jgi:hypothetical protein
MLNVLVEGGGGLHIIGEVQVLAGDLKTQLNEFNMEYRRLG